MTKLTLATLCAGLLFATGCNGAMWGNIVVLGITLGIFFGTLSLGRSAEATRSSAADASQSTAGRS